MKFSAAIKALEEGKAVRRTDWEKTYCLVKINDELRQYFRESCFSLKTEFNCADFYKEWELYEEPEKTYCFMDVVRGLREGNKYKHKNWRDWNIAFDKCIYLQGKGFDPSMQVLSLENFEATDWVEVK